MTKIVPGTLIDEQLLIDLGAVCSHLDLFSELFPEGLELTRENLLLAARHKVHIVWFGRNILVHQVGMRFLGLLEELEQEWFDCACSYCFSYRPHECAKWKKVQVKAARILWNLIQDEQNLDDFDYLGGG